MQRRGLWGPGPAEGLEAGSARRSPSERSGCRSNSLFRLSKYTTSSLAYLRPPHPPSGPETLEGTRLEERKPTRPAMDRVHTATPTSRPAHLLRAPLRSRGRTGCSRPPAGSAARTRFPAATEVAARGRGHTRAGPRRLSHRPRCLSERGRAESAWPQAPQLQEQSKLQD